jgi:hypothetical protein
MIASPEASGANNQEAACALLAKTTTAEINTLHAVGSTHLGVVKSQASYPEYTNDRLLSDTLYMLDYTLTSSLISWCGQRTANSRRRMRLSKPLRNCKQS